MADNEKTDELSLEELVRENFSKKVAERFLDEFEELPGVISDLPDSTMSGGEYYDYVKKCIAENKIPSAVDYCSRFIKDGKYTIENVSEESFDKFIKSEELAAMVQF